MELDDLKQAWNSIERRLEAQTDLSGAVLREQRAERAGRRLRPLLLGQWLQLLLGIASAGLGAQFWLTHWHEPALLVSGLIVHAYGVALIVLSLRMMLMLRRSDFSMPVLQIQQHLARVERAHVQAGLIVGLPWWVLWIPFSVVFLAMAGVDAPLAPENQAWIWVSLVLCLFAMALTLWLVIWARRGESASARRHNRAIIGASLVRAQREITALERFERNL